MIITPKQVKNLSYIVVDDLYSAEEVEQIKAELRALIPFWQPPENAKAALDDQKTPKKNAMGLFLDDHYLNREESTILKLNRRIFTKEIVDKATALNRYFEAIGLCDEDFTLVNYYGTGEEYKPHRDAAMLTAVTFFALGDVSGGDFEFSEVGEIIPFKENRAVIFPGCALHAAKKTIAGNNAFRVSMAQFLKYR